MGAYSCPRCKSENTQKLGVIFGTGTSASVGSVIGAASGGHAGGIGVAAIAATSQTAFAAKFRPPPKRKTGVFGQAIAALILAGIVGAWTNKAVFFWMRWLFSRSSSRSNLRKTRPTTGKSGRVFTPAGR